MNEAITIVTAIISAVGGAGLNAWFGRRKAAAEAVLVAAQADGEQAKTAGVLYELMRAAVLDASAARHSTLDCERNHADLVDEHEALKRDHVVLKRDLESMREELTRLQERVQAQEG